jgi:hypothetical protein
MQVPVSDSDLLSGIKTCERFFDVVRERIGCLNKFAGSIKRTAWPRFCVPALLIGDDALWMISQTRR